MISHRGKKQDVSLEGGVRIEHDNNRIVYTNNGAIMRADYAEYTAFYDPATGGEVMRLGKLLDGRYGISWYDPATGREFMRSGVLPNDNPGAAVANEGINLPDAF